MHHIILRFVFLGTFLGGGVFLLSQAIQNGMEPSYSWLNSIAMILFGSILASFLALPFGAFPAAIAGLLYWLVLGRFTSQNPSGLLRLLLGFVIGAIVCGTFGSVLLPIDGGPAYSYAHNLASFISAGMVGAAISALSLGQNTYKFAFPEKCIAQ